jgi:hypothetical protein
MRLAISYFDARSRHEADVIDQDTNQCVGYIRSGSVNFGGRYIFLFEGKYSARCASHDECLGFVKGVEAVLNHMMATGDERSSERKSSTAAA